jgi:hypothetical protein
MGEVRDDQEAHAKMVYEIYIPYFVSAPVPVGASMRQWNDDWSLPLKTISESPDAIGRLLEDLKFAALAEVRYGYKMHLTGEFEAAIAAAEAILVEIEKSKSSRSREGAPSATPAIAIRNANHYHLGYGQQQHDTRVTEARPDWLDSVG